MIPTPVPNEDESQLIETALTAARDRGIEATPQDCHVRLRRQLMMPEADSQYYHYWYEVYVGHYGVGIFKTANGHTFYFEGFTPAPR